MTDTPNLAEAQQAVRCGAYDYLPKSDGIDALRSAMIRVSEELHTESREEAYLRGQQNWDECISRLLKLLLALKPGIDEDHWQMYSKVKPLLSDAPLRMEALLVRSLMEELRAEICRRDEALAAQLRSNMMAAPLGMLTSAQGTAAYMDAIWALLSEKGYITQEDALKSDPIGRACVYMQSHLSEKLTVQELAEYVHISPRHFIRKFQAEMNEKFTDYLAHIRVQAAIQMLEAGRDVKSIPEAVGYKDEKSFLFRVPEVRGLFHARISTETELEPAKGEASMIKLWNQTMPHRCVEDAFEPYLTPYDCDAAKTAIVGVRAALTAAGRTMKEMTLARG